MVMTKHQSSVNFLYERSSNKDTISLYVGTEPLREFPISYTINECLEDYCTEQQWDFHHIYFSVRPDECSGYGRFYYYHMLETIEYV